MLFVLHSQCHTYWCSCHLRASASATMVLTPKHQKSWKWNGACPGGGGGTHYVRVMGRLRGIDPPFFKALEKNLDFRPPFFKVPAKNIDFRPPFFLGFYGKKSILDPFFRPDIDFRPPFFGTIDFRVSGPQGAYLSPSLKECPPPPPPPPPGGACSWNLT